MIINRLGASIHTVVPRTETREVSGLDFGRMLVLNDHDNSADHNHRMDSTLLEATMWSWQEGEPHAYFSSPRAAVVHQDTGRSAIRKAVAV